MLKKVLKRFGYLVRERRSELGVSQEKLAELCDLSLRRVVGIENGESNLTFSNLIRLCVTLNIDCGELSQFYTPPYEDEEEIIDVSFLRR